MYRALSLVLAVVLLSLIGSGFVSAQGTVILTDYLEIPGLLRIFYPSGWKISSFDREVAAGTMIAGLEDLTLSSQLSYLINAEYNSVLMIAIDPLTDDLGQVATVANSGTNPIDVINSLVRDGVDNCGEPDLLYANPQTGALIDFWSGYPGTLSGTIAIILPPNSDTWLRISIYSLREDWNSYQPFADLILQSLTWE